MNYTSNRKENKSIRAKIKNLSHINSKEEDEIESRFISFNKNDYLSNKKSELPNNKINNSNDNEISFNITPEEEEITYQLIKTNSLDSSFNNNIEDATQTKDNSEIFGLENYKMQKEAKDLIEKTKKVMKNLDQIKSIPHNEDKNLNIDILKQRELKVFPGRFFFKLEKKNLQMNINDRLLEKIKIIKNYEKELKEKNNLIDKLQLKIDKLSEEIKKSNVKSNVS